MKAAEVGELRAQTLTDNREALEAAAAALRACFEAGGKLLALGNGGSATDAMDAVADFRAAPQGWPARPALDLTEDPAILTALANDVGAEVLFQRQIIAYGRPGDAVLALSTSGGSPNVILALEEARRRGLVTIALVGYDGGRVAAEGLADHVIVTRSQHIPRIQEAQASAYHVLRELVERPGSGPAPGAAAGRRRLPAARAGARRGHRPGGRVPALRPPRGGRAGPGRVGAERRARRAARGRGRPAGDRRPAGAPGRRRAAPRHRRAHRRGGAARDGGERLRHRRERAGRRAGGPRDPRRRDLRGLPRASSSTPPTAATATRSSTAPTAGRGSRSPAGCPTTAR